MLLRLIQAGGFAGKPKYAEIDISEYPADLQNELIEYLCNKPAEGSSTTQSVSRDAFKYIFQYENKQKEIGETLELSPALEQLFEQLKEDLHY